MKFPSDDVGGPADFFRIPAVNDRAEVARE
jgi:hypothetical protein